MPVLKDVIEARDGKLVIRPDSGDPVKIICGDPDAPEGSAQRRGAIEVLGETFGWTVNSRGYRRLNPKVGLIYGDSITPERAREILSRLLFAGVAPDCVVFGVGSFTYQMVTRDTWGMAVKATHGVVNGEPRHIYKAPKTDGGSKRSLKGRVSVRQNADGGLYVVDGLVEDDPKSMLEKVYEDGAILRPISFNDVRDLAKTWLPKRNELI